MAERLIFHIDVNSAFLSWEAVYRLEQGESLDLRTVPSVVGGDEASRHGIVLAKSIPAKRYGIQTGEPIASAKQKCPGLVCVPSSKGLYSRCSHAFIDILKRYAPVIEQVSVDEAYADMTGTSRLYGTPMETALLIKDTIKGELGFTVNVGISSNKLLAKMASDFEKPDKIHTLFPDEIPTKMWPLPVDQLFGVGKSSALALNGLGIRTIGDLAHADQRLLEKKFKKMGILLWQHANGMEESPVNDIPEDAKSYGRESTLSHDVTDWKEAAGILLRLCESVGQRLRADGVRASCITVKYTDYLFRSQSHQKSLFSPTNVTEEIYENALSLLRNLWKDRTPLRLIGVSAGKVTEDAVYQYSLFEGDRHERLEKLDQAIDSIRGKFGADAIQRGRSYTGSFHTGKKALGKEISPKTTREE